MANFLIKTAFLAEFLVAQELIMLLRKPPTFLCHSKETNGRLEHELSLFDILLSIFELSWLNIRWDYRLYIIHFFQSWCWNPKEWLSFWKFMGLKATYCTFLVYVINLTGMLVHTFFVHSGKGELYSWELSKLLFLVTVC